jgi:serine/threonine-protein kinase
MAREHESATPTVLAKQPSTKTRGRRRTTGGLPADLLADATRRLRLLALVYAGTFFLAAFLPVILCFQCADMPEMAGRQVATGMTSIALGLGVFGLTFVRRLEPAALISVGLVFEVLGSYGIALAEYPGLSGALAYRGDQFGGFGLSWVSAWVIVFSIVVPTPPGRAILAALAAVAAVPLTFAFGVDRGWITLAVPPGPFFFSLVFPYLLVAGLAWVSSRVVYGLGREIREARELGSYALVERLGQGGMGEVWRARHRFLARPAAIKLVRPERVGGDTGTRRVALARFEREAQATALMRCPHTIDLYDFGTTDDGSFYYVMELLDGLDVETLIEEHGPLPAERAIHLLRQVCHSLGEAHDRGLIHRDIKPANIYLCRYGRELDWIKVLDFGIVKVRGDTQRDDVRLTAEQSAGGTPAYMAPEQILGNEPADGRTDIYALGCVAYWMLTGRLVFEGHTAMDTMMRHVQDRPTPPSSRTELSVPEAFDQVVMACLEKDPDHRPSTADAVDTALAAVPLPERWSRERASRWWAFHRPPTEGWDSAPSPGLATPSPPP